MFKIGDTVLYGATGVCKIGETVVREIGGMKKEYLVLRPVSKEQSAVFVPTDNEALLAKMRRMLSREEIEKIIAEAKNEPDIWVEDDILRREKWAEIIHSGDRKRVILLIRTLYGERESRRQTGKRLHLSDERYLTEAERLIYDEFSAVLEIPSSEVISYITEK